MTRAPSTAASRHAADAGRIALSTSVTAITATLSATTSAALAVAAGSATVPVVGWVVAAVAVVLAALTTLTEALLSARIRRREAVHWATLMGLPEPEKIPGFIVDLHLTDFRGRMEIGNKLTEKIARTRNPKIREGLERKRGLVAIVLTREWLAANAAKLKQPSPVLPAASPVVLRVEYGGTSWTPFLVGGMLVTAAAVLVVSANAARSPDDAR